MVTTSSTATRQRYVIGVGLAVLGTVFGCSTESETNGATSQPEVFAPEVISVGNVYRGTFTPDGKNFYFFKKVTEGAEDYRIFVSRQHEGEWTEPEQLNLGGPHSDLYPSISPDGQRMMFSSYRRVTGDTSSTPNANLWYVDREGAGWGTPVFVASASTLSHYDAKPFFGPDGTVYFESTTPDWRSKQSLTTRWDGSTYPAPEVFEDVERWRTWRPDLYVWGGVPGPDGSFVVLDVSERHAESGRALPSDQWVTFRSRDGSWTEPVRLQSDLNSEGYDNFTFFSPDGRRLFFVRDFAEFYSMPLETALAPLRPDGDSVR